MLIGEKVELNVIERVDLEWLRDRRNDPELRQYFREWKDISSDQQEKWYSSRGNNSDPNHVYFAIFNKHAESLCSTNIIGCTGLHYIDWRLRSAEFGIFLDQKARGGGRGKEALKMLCDYGFKEMNLHKIWCEVFDNNQSINLYSKLGFRADGVLRDTYFHNGKYGNSTIMSVFENEWFELHG